MITNESVLKETKSHQLASTQQNGLALRRFEAKATHAPELIAVRFDGQGMTYGELNDRATRLAVHLRLLGVVSHSRVGLSVDRSLDMIVGILAILKAGAAYVPIDPSYPEQRQSYILQDAGIQVLLTQSQLKSKFPSYSGTLVIVDAFNERIVDRIQLTDCGIAPEDVAYVIYTSGSTGQPKGVEVTHANMAWFIDNMTKCFDVGDRDVWGQFHSFSFDVSVWEIWGALATGGMLVIMPYMTSRSPEAVSRFLRSERVTVLCQTPSAFRQLMRADETLNDFSQKYELRYVFLAGESLEPRSLQPWVSRHGSKTPQLINAYGPTEATVYATYRVLTEDDFAAKSRDGTPIGKAIPNAYIRILDSQLQPVPPGERGELCIGGGGVAKGYLNRPELTIEKFVPDPLSPDQRLYRTGDLASFRTNEEIEFHGRLDDQIKIRGFRVELGEIEAVLAQCRNVRESAVVARDDETGQKRLIAYVAGTQLNVAELRHEIGEKLPEYMVPSPIHVLPALPLNANGKIDRAALPTVVEHEPTALSPNLNTVETRVAEVWRDVIGRSAGPDDNFFDLGGSSIDLAEVHLRLRSRFERDLEIVDLFQNPTVRTLARHLEGTDDGGQAQHEEMQDRAKRQQAALARQKRMREVAT
jgi:amino acid adenylation domain-containing protein